MNTESVYVLMKGDERVSMTDHNSLIALSNALLVLGCTELLCQKEIKGHKQTDDTFEVLFLDKHIKVVGVADVEKVVHWMLSYGCNIVNINRLQGEEDEGTD